MSRFHCNLVHFHYINIYWIVRLGAGVILSRDIIINLLLFSIPAACPCNSAIH